MFIVWEDSAAGTAFISPAEDGRPDSHSCEVFKGSYEDCKDYVKRMKQETVRYAVFFNGPADEGFISKENMYSGNWRGNKYGNHYSYMGDFETYGEALTYLESL